MRVLGVAFRPLDGTEADSPGGFEHDLTFVGLVGMIDPPRPEARAAVETCMSAGIRPVMITGDHPLTAHYIARELGIARNGQVLTGHELDALSPSELEQAAEDVAVFARVTPEHKLKLVQAVRARGHVVAMTGDGVNDAPALKRADIGVAMGITGTDVTKEAADMVLLDDNFATIVEAVEEGRVIYDNIRKFIKYMMTTNSAELAVMLIGPLIGMPLPLLPLQILWMNLVTDGPTAVALGFEPAEPGTMRRAPYRTDESILGRGLGRHIVWVGMLMALVALGVGYLYWRGGHEQWQTMLFTTLVLAQLAHVLAIRSGQESLFTIGLLSNRLLLAAVVGSVALHLVLLYVPFARELFDLVPLSATDLALCVLVASVIFWAVEIEKWLGRRARSRGQ
jgi:P-type Ca2+ transporter type 2C